MAVQDYLNNKKWLERMDKIFEFMDYNKKGFITRENFLENYNRLDKRIPDRKEFLARARKAAEEWLDVFGLVEGIKADKLKYRELSAAFALNELELFEKKELTQEEKRLYALFDVMDRKGNGYLSLEEYKELMMILDEKLTDEDIQAAFNLLDTDKNGKLDKKKYAAAEFRFWFVLEDSSTDSLFGNRFSD